MPASLVLLLSATLSLPAAAADGDASISRQAALAVEVGGERYLLPAAGEAADPAQPPPPVDPATLATLEVWRAFAWDAEDKKYRYSFAVPAGTSAAVVLTPDGSAGQLAQSLDAAARRVAEAIGAEQLRKTYVAVVCATQAEYERAVDFAAARALEAAQDPEMQAYLRGAWPETSKRSPTFYQDQAGIVGCVEGNSEKWSPEHEIVRGFAVVAVLGGAPQLWHVLPFLIGLSWNVEYDVLGDILSMPYGDEFQFDIGRGTWSASKLASLLKRLDKEARKRDGRAGDWRDLPYLGRGEGSTSDAAAVAWAASRHLLRHHGERLPGLLAALSAEVLARNTVVQGDGSTSYRLAPDYQLGWEEIAAVLAAQAGECGFEEFAACVGASCAPCKAWAKERGIR